MLSQEYMDIDRSNRRRMGGVYFGLAAMMEYIQLSMETHIQHSIFRQNGVAFSSYWFVVRHVKADVERKFQS